ncbi:AraC family transcriptional regulator [Nocardia alni]|uniref:AraC family transcriptional regulator n=1 Tax=Nocardia alni TaxID=2815723 RepID=UPI001C247E3C|nr:AraC family transcriptional regulator [Nocardia alni]
MYNQGDAAARVRSIHSAVLLAEFGIARGLPVDVVLRGTGIGAGDLTDPSAEITLEQEFAVMRNVVTGVGDEPGLGLLAGMSCHPASMGIWGFAISASPTLRDALEIGLRYADLSFTAATHHLTDRGQDVLVVRDDSMVPAEIRRFALERDLVGIGTMQQDVLPIRLPAVRLELDLVAHLVYEAVMPQFGVCEMVFDASRTVLILRASSLELALPQANPASRALYEQQCAAIVQQRNHRRGFSAQVRELLIGHRGMADQSDIAACLGISVRTLRRRLDQDGTSFRELRCETVGLLAEELLGAGLTVESVAARLGYSSVSAFSLKFQSWKGQTPGQFARRRRMRGLD